MGKAFFSPKWLGVAFYVEPRSSQDVPAIASPRPAHVCIVDAAVDASVETFWSSPSWATAFQSDLVVSVVVLVLSSTLDILHQVTSSSLAFPSRQVKPSEHVLPRT